MIQIVIWGIPKKIVQNLGIKRIIFQRLVFCKNFRILQHLSNVLSPRGNSGRGVRGKKLIVKNKFYTFYLQWSLSPQLYAVESKHHSPGPARFIHRSWIEILENCWKLHSVSAKIDDDKLNWIWKICHN